MLLGIGISKTEAVDVSFPGIVEVTSILRVVAAARILVAVVVGFFTAEEVVTLAGSLFVGFIGDVVYFVTFVWFAGF